MLHSKNFYSWLVMDYSLLRMFVLPTTTNQNLSSVKAVDWREGEKGAHRILNKQKCKIIRRMFLQMIELTYCEGSLASIERRGRDAHDDHAVCLSVDRLGQKIAEEGWESPLLHPRTCLLIF